MHFFVILVLTLTSIGANPDRNSSIIHRFISRGFESVDWCKLSCKGEENIACTHKGQCLTPVGTCKFLTVNKQEILDEHNKFRNLFAMGEDPRTGGLKVANMMWLDWDDGLAFTAHCNLKECPKKMEHDKCRITEKFKFAGQNLAWQSSTDQSLNCITSSPKMVFRWYEEVQYLTPEQLKGLGVKFESNKNPDHAVGHFTQLAWATLTHVGCALYAMFDEGTMNCMLACNYGPGGNMIGDSMFQEGSPASACPKGIKPNGKYPGLCGGDPAGAGAISVKIVTALFIFPVIVIFQI